MMSEMSMTDYAIYAEDGSMFCMCHCDGDKIELEGKGGKRISLIDLQRYALNPELAQKGRGKRQRLINRTAKE